MEGDSAHGSGDKYNDLWYFDNVKHSIQWLRNGTKCSIRWLRISVKCNPGWLQNRSQCSQIYNPNGAKCSLIWLRNGAKCSLEWLRFSTYLPQKFPESIVLKPSNFPFQIKRLSRITRKRAKSAFFAIKCVYFGPFRVILGAFWRVFVPVKLWERGFRGGRQGPRDRATNGTREQGVGSRVDCFRSRVRNSGAGSPWHSFALGRQGVSRE